MSNEEYTRRLHGRARGMVMMKRESCADLDEGKRILGEAETALRKLVAKAAASGDYDTVVVLADWARAVRSMAGSVEFDSAETDKGSGSGSNPKTASAPRPQVSSRAKYPQFFREKDSLTKVAWSKASKAEYEHKAPKQVVQILVTALLRVRGRDRLISMDKVLPLTAPDGSEIPSYQSYLTVAWLRHTGLLRQHGRQGYSIKAGLDFEKEVAREWESLSQRS